MKKEMEKDFLIMQSWLSQSRHLLMHTQKFLKADEVLVAWYFSENVGYVWAISKKGAPIFTQLAIGKTQIPGVLTIDEISPFDVALAHKLYKQILAPVEDGFKGKR